MRFYIHTLVTLVIRIVWFATRLFWGAAVFHGGGGGNRVPNGITPGRILLHLWDHGSRAGLTSVPSGIHGDPLILKTILFAITIQWQSLRLVRLGQGIVLHLFIIQWSFEKIYILCECLQGNCMIFCFLRAKTDTDRQLEIDRQRQRDRQRDRKTEWQTDIKTGTERQRQTETEKHSDGQT